MSFTVHYTANGTWGSPGTTVLNNHKYYLSSVQLLLLSEISTQSVYPKIYYRNIYATWLQTRELPFYPSLDTDNDKRRRKIQDTQKGEHCSKKTHYHGAWVTLPNSGGLKGPKRFTTSLITHLKHSSLRQRLLQPVHITFSSSSLSEVSPF